MSHSHRDSEQNALVAKQIFWDHACSRFHMDREGVLSKYAELGGSPEREGLWREAYIALWISRIDPVDCTALFQLRNAHSHEAIQGLLKIEDPGDDYSKFWLADTLMALSRAERAETEDVELAREKAVALWQEILANPNGIISEHKRQMGKEARTALNAKSAEEYIRNYTKIKLEESL